MNRDLRVALGSAVIILSSSPALADDPDPCKKAARAGADALNAEYSVAECDAQAWKTATAWRELMEVAEHARAAGREPLATQAKARAEAIEPSIIRVTIDVTPLARAATGLTIRMDGGIVEPAKWGTPIPIDAGVYTVVATAPGRRPFFARVYATAGGETSLHVAITGLNDQPVAAFSGPGSTQRVVGLVTWIGGLAVVGAGFGFGLAAQSSWESFLNYGAGFGGNSCRQITTSSGVPPRTLCPQGSYDTAQRAYREAVAANVLVTTGVVLFVGGLVVFLTAPSNTKAPRVGLSVTPGYAGLVGRGTF